MIFPWELSSKSWDATLYCALLVARVDNSRQGSNRGYVKLCTISGEKRCVVKPLDWVLLRVSTTTTRMPFPNENSSSHQESTITSKFDWFNQLNIIFTFNEIVSQNCIYFFKFFFEILSKTHYWISIFYANILTSISEVIIILPSFFAFSFVE